MSSHRESGRENRKTEENCKTKQAQAKEVVDADGGVCTVCVETDGRWGQLSEAPAEKRFMERSARRREVWVGVKPSSPG